MTKQQFITEARRSGVRLAMYAAALSGVCRAQVELWALTINGGAV